MRNIKYIVLHCTATQPETTIASIQRHWKEDRGWSTPGYHYIITLDGTLVKLLDEDKNSNGVYLHNSECINISYIGGIDKAGKPKDTRTKKQERTMFNKIIEIMERYPQAKVLGHRDFPGVKKACPSFDVKTWFSKYTPDTNLAA